MLIPKNEAALFQIKVIVINYEKGLRNFLHISDWEENWGVWAKRPLLWKTMGAFEFLWALYFIQ